MRAGDAAENAPPHEQVRLPTFRVEPGGGELFTQFVRHDQRNLQAEAGSHPALARLAEEAFPAVADAVEKLAGLLRVGVVGIAFRCHEFVRIHRHGNRSHRRIAPSSAAGVPVFGAVGPPHASIGFDILRKSYPDLRLEAVLVRGIGVEADEIHAQLGHLPQVMPIILFEPSIGALGEIMEGMQAAHREERTPVRLHLGKFLQAGLGNAIRVQVEANPPCLAQVVSCEKRTRLVKADDHKVVAASLEPRADHRALGAQRPRGCDFLLQSRSSRSDRGDRCGKRIQPSGAQPAVAPQLRRRQSQGKRGGVPEMNVVGSQESAFARTGLHGVDGS